MKLRILTESDVRAVLDMRSAIDIQAEAFTLLAEGKSTPGLRSFAMSEQPPGVAIFNPCFLAAGAGYGIKVVSDFYENEHRGVPRMMALVALFDGETGAPTTVMEGGFLTDMRTGAITGLAARHLARKDCRNLVIFGAGRVARNQLEALSEVMDLAEVKVVTRTRARGEAFVARMKQAGGRIPGDIKLVAPEDRPVRNADIVVCATTASEPIFDGRDLRPGTFVAATGAYEATTREVDSETIKRSRRWVIDSRSDCLDHAGDLLIPIAEGVIKREQVAEIAELVAGKSPGREGDDEITYFKSSGVPIQDLITGQHVARRAAERAIGAIIDIGGDHD
jgi:ornithine cyclodeaminase/alanine dehydrogenase-like protein (mu-crystallin family)